MHIENGNVMVRRLHRIEIQARDGRLYVIRGKNLPDGFVSNTGHGHKGEHIAQILLRPESIRNLHAPDVDFWPKARDVLHVGLGVFGFLMLRFFISLLQNL
jgi:hypothetical protein